MSIGYNLYASFVHLYTKIKWLDKIYFSACLYSCDYIFIKTDRNSNQENCRSSFELP